jgi:hypothetical protein
MDELAPEDQFRLEILFTRPLQAVRIDESRMILHALAEDGEAQLPLHPNDKPDRYLRRVREALASYALGSPRGYPVHLSRWIRHGQLASEKLAQLLLTGEPEAITAVIYSPALTDEIARRAWWAMPTIENARLMLQRPAVAQGQMGPHLAAFLVEHMPFLQDDHLGILDTVITLLYSEILTPEQELTLWRRGRRSTTHLVGFLELRATRLPEARNSDDDLAFVRTALEIFEKPETQEVITRTLNAIGQHFTQRMTTHPSTTIAALAAINASLVESVFARTTAIGSLMREKTEPALRPVREALQQLAV